MPTWLNQWFSHVGFFFGFDVDGQSSQENAPMNKPRSHMAHQIAQAAIAFEQRRTGNRVPKSVTVVLSEGTLVITLHDALSPAERDLARSPAGAAKMQEFHRNLFANSADSLLQEIKRITGMEVREATAEIEPASGAVVHAFTTGTMVQVFLLDGNVPSDTWSGTGPGGQSSFPDRLGTTDS